MAWGWRWGCQKNNEYSVVGNIGYRRHYNHYQLVLFINASSVRLVIWTVIIIGYASVVFLPYFCQLTPFVGGALHAVHSLADGQGGDGALYVTAGQQTIAMMF